MVADVPVGGVPSGPAVRGVGALYAAILLLALVPLAGLTAFGYVTTDRHLTALAHDRLRAVADLSARTLAERFARLIDLGTSLATRVRFRQLVAEGKWSEAMPIMGDVPRDFPQIDRILLCDPSGVLRADLPEVAEVRGVDFSYRDWCLGLKRTGRPYVSEVYRRKAAPPVNVVAGAFPVRRDDGALAGILVLQVRLETLVAWSREHDLGEGVEVEFVDHHGRVAAHPGLDPQAEVIDVHDAASVREALAGRSGVALEADPVLGEEGLVAFAPVEGAGWGAMATQPVREAYRLRSDNLRTLLETSGLVLALTGALSYLLFRALRARERAEGRVLGLVEDLRRQTRGLEAANTELDAFSYSVSHDLRAPLRAVEGFSRAIEEDCGATLDAAAKEHLGVVRAEARRMSQLIEDLLRLSRLSRADMRVEEVDLAPISREVVEGLRRADPARAVEAAIPDALPARGDAALLRVVLENLIGNAWKFTSRNGRARIEVGRDGEAFFVRDDGAGFDPAFAHRLFRPFQRLHSLEEFPGSGIGLATVQRVVHRHGGRVWAESAPGKGATVRFTLGTAS